MAGPSYPLHGLLPDKILSSSLRWDRQDKLALLGALDGFGCGFTNGNPSDSTSDSTKSSNILAFSFALFSWSLLPGIARTLLAAFVTAASTDLAGSKGGLALMACSMNAHANRLFNTLLSRASLPVVQIQFKIILQGQFASSLQIRIHRLRSVGLRGGRCWGRCILWRGLS